MTNLNKSTGEIVTANLTRVQTTVFPPSSAEEAKKIGVFESPNGTVYCHFNGTVATKQEDGSTKAEQGLVLAYGELASKIGELLLETVVAQKADKKFKKAPHMVVHADINMEAKPWADANGGSGHNVTYKIWGFHHDGKYYTMRNGTLLITASTVGAPAAENTRKSTVSFF